MRKFDTHVPDITGPEFRHAINNADAEIVNRVQRAPESVVVEGVTAPVIGDPFVVTHNLGVRPNYAQGLHYGTSYVGLNGADLWADDNDRKRWNEKSIVLRSMSQSARVTVFVAYV